MFFGYYIWEQSDGWGMISIPRSPSGRFWIHQETLQGIKLESSRANECRALRISTLLVGVYSLMGCIAMVTWV